MKRKNLSRVAMVVLCALTLTACDKPAETTQVDRVAMEAKAKAEAEAKAVEAAAKEAEARAIAIESYVYAYPLVTMEMTRRIMTNVEAPQGSRAPMGHFVRMRSYPDASYRDVTAPNADTLYTTTWIDVSKEPWILSLPDMKDRYALFPMLDGFTNVF